MLLNEDANDKLYGYEMKPIVKAEDDARSSKESDLSILKMHNHRTCYNRVQTFCSVNHHRRPKFF